MQDLSRHDTKVIEELYNKLPEDLKQHSINVANISKKIACDTKIDSLNAYYSGLMHDIGKIYIPDIILYKQDSLTPMEKQIIDFHAFYGYKMLTELGICADIAVPVLYSHGFNKPSFEVVPDATISQTKIAQIIKIADIYDALKSERSYKPAYDNEQIISIIQNDESINQKFVKSLINMIE